MRFAANEFRLNKAQSDGASLREHLSIIARQSGKTPQELIPVPCPALMLPVWQMFLELHAARAYGMEGPLALSFSEIAAFNSLMRRQLTPGEVTAIKAVDQAFLREQAQGAHA